MKSDVMGEIRISDSLSRGKKTLKTLERGKVRMYVCGVTVYDRCHLGHARSALVFDLILRVLRYHGYEVNYVKNFTDVDDKIIHRAEQEGRSWKEVAESYIASYREDMRRLGVLEPTVEPKATEHIGEIVAMTQRLIERGYAYVVDGDVFFEVSRFPRYGALSGRRVEELMAGARVEVDTRKRDPLDFALWKAAKPGEPSWESPWGPGRPGWHIECSAMSIKHLGETFDIHGGGQDLVFPHHENEMAQSESSTGKPFARLWVHNGFVTINQEKMSKSLGNFFTVEEIFEKSKHLFGTDSDRKIAEIIRYFLFSVHYRSPIDFSEESLKETKSALDNIYLMLFDLQQKKADAGGDGLASDRPAQTGGSAETLLRTALQEVEAALEDDFNAPVALAVLQRLRAEVNKTLSALSPESAGRILGFFRETMGSLLGLFQCDPGSEWGIVEFSASGLQMGEDVLPAGVLQKLREREEARRLKDWPRADRIRGELAREGFLIDDRPGGITRVTRG